MCVGKITKKRVFTEDQKEWIQTLANVFATILKLKIKPVIVYDRKHFTKFVTKGRLNGNQVWAECIRETGTIWLSKRLVNATKIEQINTIIHELLHIKYPLWTEKQVTDHANKMAPVIYDTDILDNVHKREINLNRKYIIIQNANNKR